MTAYRNGITDPRELANFMGQVQHESQNFTRLEENLNYSGSRLYDVFPKRNGLTREGAQSIANIPDKTERQHAVAEQVYGGEWGKARLGNTEPGDAFTFRGRGYIQLTGRSNYTDSGPKLGLDLVRHPELAANQQNAERIAVQYWKDNVQPVRSARTQAGAAQRSSAVAQLPPRWVTAGSARSCLLSTLIDGLRLASCAIIGLALEAGRRASSISMTTSIPPRRSCSSFLALFMCPGNHWMAMYYRFRSGSSSDDSPL